MSWGFFKKAKRGLKKAGEWLKNAINKTAEVMKKTKPILQQIENDETFKKGWGQSLERMRNGKRKLTQIADDVINVNEHVKNNDLAGAINYAGRQFVPKFRI